MGHDRAFRMMRYALVPALVIWIWVVWQIAHFVT